MSNILISHAGLMDDAVYTASSEATGFDVENVANIQPSKTWRTTALTTQSITVDLGSVKTFDFIGLFFTNVTNDSSNVIRVSTADTEANLTASPTYVSGITRMVPLDAQGDYDYANILFQITEQTNRWVLIELSASANTDAYIEVGRLYIAKAFVPDINIAYGWGMGIEDLTKPTQALGGATYPNPLSKTRVLKYSLDFQSESQMYDYSFANDRLLGASKDIFIHRDVDNLDRYLDYAIYGLQQSLQPIINTNYGLFSQRYMVRELL